LVGGASASRILPALLDYGASELPHSHLPKLSRVSGQCTVVLVVVSSTLTFASSQLGIQPTLAGTQSPASVQTLARNASRNRRDLTLTSETRRHPRGGSFRSSSASSFSPLPVNPTILPHFTTSYISVFSSYGVRPRCCPQVHHFPPSPTSQVAHFPNPLYPACAHPFKHPSQGPTKMS